MATIWMALAVAAALAAALATTLAAEKNFAPVTYGSIVKLRHMDSLHNLHSHLVKYGTGSGQQSVTAFAANDDDNSLWVVELAHGMPTTRGTAVRCGALLRLRHLATGARLHSHSAHRSPISKNYEVSAFPDVDRGDNWTVECKSTSPAAKWLRDAPVLIRHKDTGCILVSNPSRRYESPIAGQLEISCVPSTAAAPPSDSRWQTDYGIYFPESPSPLSANDV